MKNKAKNQNYLSFENARAFARSLKLSGKSEWERISSNELPLNIPKSPAHIYANKGWQGWGDFLGTGNIAPKELNYRSLREARAYVRTLGLKNTAEWKAWANSSKRPKDIPAYPQQAYSKKGWISYADFLGTKVIANRRTFRPFNEARNFAKSLKLQSKKEWSQWVATNLPIDLPKCPNHVYADQGWQGWGDFLGTVIIAKGRKYRLSHKKDKEEYLPFEEASSYARSLKLKSMADWKKMVKTDSLPPNIPSYPNAVYKNKGWKGAGDFLGTGNIASQNRQYMQFEDARTFARSLELKSMTEWRKWAKSKARPQDISATPWGTYANKGYKGIGDFLGTNTIAPQNRKFRSYKEAQVFAQSIELRGKEEWVKWAKTDSRPDDIPAYPNEVYAKKGWDGWGNFLGTGFTAHKDREYRSFQNVRDFVRSLKLKNKEDWANWAKSDARLEDIPKSPSHIYAKEWQGWGDFLGTERIANQNKVFRPFEEARAFARSLGLKSQDQWRDWVKTPQKPEDIPSNPSAVYEDKWIGWGDWLEFYNSWNVSNIRAFVASLIPVIDTLSPADLYVLFQQTGLLEVSRNSKGRSFVQALKTGRFPKEELEKFINGESSLVDEFLGHSTMSLEGHIAGIQKDPLEAPINSLSEDEPVIHDELPSVDTKDILSTLDCKLFSTLDREAVDYYIKRAVARIWQHAFKNEAVAIQQFEQYQNEGVYSQEVKRLFLNEYQGTKALQIPPGYTFAHQPKALYGISYEDS